MKNKLIKKSGPVLLLFLIVLIPVLYRGITYSGFRYDASFHANMQPYKDNKITHDELFQYQDNSLFVQLGPSSIPAEKFPVSFLKVNPDSVLIKEYFRKMRKHNGPVILVNTEPSVAARVWMILKQKGIKDLYILTDK